MNKLYVLCALGSSVSSPCVLGYGKRMASSAFWCVTRLQHNPVLTKRASKLDNTHTHHTKRLLWQWFWIFYHHFPFEFECIIINHWTKHIQINEDFEFFELNKTELSTVRLKIYNLYKNFCLWFLNLTKSFQWKPKPSLASNLRHFIVCLSNGNGVKSSENFNQNIL